MLPPQLVVRTLGDPESGIRLSGKRKWLPEIWNPRAQMNLTRIYPGGMFEPTDKFHPGQSDRS